MKTVLTYLLLLIVLPSVGQTQARYSGRKTISAGGVRFDIHSPGVCFGQNPIFLVPIDTIGNVSFTGMINNIKVMGRFAPYASAEDTSEVQDPMTSESIVVYDSFLYAKKNGEWSYHCYDGISYYEYYDKGELIKRDSLEGVFTVGKREIKIVDSMARIRSMVDLYIKKGTR